MRRRLALFPIALFVVLWVPGCGERVTGQPSQEQPSQEQPSQAAPPLSPRQDDLDGTTIATRIAPPPGYERVAVDAGSFGAWLRQLPLHPGRPPVHLHDGRRKGNQDVHYAVVDMDVGRRDLQQCADAVMRLRAEYLFARGCGDDIVFRFTSGDLAAWSEWRQGSRPRVRGNDVSWQQSAESDGSYENFRRYLDIVFSYAGTASLEREIDAVADPARVQIGDVFIQGGFPGHAVLVADVAEPQSADGTRVFLLVQSYMPAQEIHVLKNPGSAFDPWYEARSVGHLITPEWNFRHTDLRRFPAPSSCVSAP